MIKSGKLSAFIIGTATVAMLSGTSAFAETRLRDETRDNRARSNVRTYREDRGTSQTTERAQRTQTQTEQFAAAVRPNTRV